MHAPACARGRAPAAAQHPVSGLGSGRLPPSPVGLLHPPAFTCCKRAATLRAASSQQQPLASSRRSSSSSSRSSSSSTQPARGPLGVVLTGATRGLGFCLAREFLAAGDRLVICGRDGRRLAAALRTLRAEFPDGHVVGLQADVSQAGDMAALGTLAVEELPLVHLWINNAGQVTSKRLLADVPAEEIAAAAGANVLGSLLGCREAVRIMRSQPPGSPPPYHICNFGFSRWGAKLSKSAVTHKATKRALAQLTESLAEELQEAGLASIGVHNVSPGLVLTDLLLRDAPPAARRFFNALALEPEAAAAQLVPRLRSLRSAHGEVALLSPPLAVARVLSRLPEVLRGGRYFDAAGRRVPAGPGVRYQDNGVRLLYDVEPE